MPGGIGILAMSADPETQLTIAYLLMQMPAPAEVFLSAEVNALIEVGVRVLAFSLRQPHPEHEQLVASQDLTSVPLIFTPYLFSQDLWRSVLYWERRHPGIWRESVSLVTRKCRRRPSLWLRSIAILPKSFHIARIIEQEGVQIIHAAWGHYPAITAYLVKQLLPNVGFTLALGAYDRLMRHPMTEVAAAIADGIVTQSEGSAELIRHDWPQPATPVHVIFRGVDLRVTDRSCDRFKRTPPLVVAVGRLIDVKGHQQIIRALAQIRRDLPEVELMILGEGPYRKELEELVSRLGLEGAVQMPGHLPQSDLFEVLAQAGVFALASESRADNLPNAVKEAMILGIPVVTTPTTAITELVRNGETGYIVPMGDTVELAKRICELLTDTELASRMAKRAKEHVIRHFDLEQTTQERVILYEEIRSRYSIGESAL